MLIPIKNNIRLFCVNLDHNVRLLCIMRRKDLTVMLGLYQNYIITFDSTRSSVMPHLNQNKQPQILIWSPDQDKQHIALT